MTVPTYAEDIDAIARLVQTGSGHDWIEQALAEPLIQRKIRELIERQGQAVHLAHHDVEARVREILKERRQTDALRQPDRRPREA
jgi:hypothetical protein